MTGPVPLRDDPATTTCPICQACFTRIGRQIYCSTPCRKTAFRRRHQNPTTALTIPPGRPRRDYTIYECPDCGERLYGEQRCTDCGTFARRIGIGGPCPHCLLTELADVAGVSRPAPLLHLEAWPTSTASLKLILR